MIDPELRKLLLVGIVGGLMFFGALWLAITPADSRGGIIDSTMLAIVGNRYHGRVHCEERPKGKPSLVKGFFGLHGGKRVSVRAWSYTDASDRLKRAHPKCDVSVLERSRSKGVGFKFSF